MEAEMAIALKYDGGIIFRNVRPINVLVAELEAKGIEYALVSPDTLKYSAWNLVLIFKDKETKEMFVSGQITYNENWRPDQGGTTQRVNPLKAAKRAAKGGK